MALRLAHGAAVKGRPAAALIEEAFQHAERANRELRDVVRGILPASLSRGGVRSALESVVSDLALPVELRVDVPRLPAPVETTVYYIVAEALTNVVKHARASRATVTVTLDGDRVAIEVRDDGSGGADPTRGTGLTGLLDRAEAANGTLVVDSPPGAGTTLQATLARS